MSDVHSLVLFLTEVAAKPLLGGVSLHCGEQLPGADSIQPGWDVVLVPAFIFPLGSYGPLMLFVVDPCMYLPLAMMYVNYLYIRWSHKRGCVVGRSGEQHQVAK